VRAVWRDLPDELQPNFLFPTSPYNSDTMFGHEFGSIACFLEECLTDGAVCIEAIKKAQLTICGRISDHLDGNLPEICAIQSSTFLYLPKKKIIYQRDVVSTDLLEGTTVVGTPRLPKFNELSLEYQTGFDKNACIETENIFNRIIDKSINSLNLMSASDPALRREMFCIALTILDHLSGRLEQDVSFTDDQVSDLWKKFENEKSVPYPDHLFRYHANYQNPSRIARSKFWRLFKDTTTPADSALSATPGYKRVIHYLKILDIASDISTELRIHQKIKSLKKAKDILGAKRDLGLPEGFKYSPYGLLLLDSDFTKMMSNLHHAFHVIHGTDLELHQMNIEGKSPEVSLWVPESRNVRKLAATVNKLFSPLIDYLESLPLQFDTPFGRLYKDVGFDHHHRMAQPLWLQKAITLSQDEVKK